MELKAVKVLSTLNDVSDFDKLFTNSKSRDFIFLSFFSFFLISSLICDIEKYNYRIITKYK